ncbi:hypothetical protein RQCS_11470 [Rhodococcus qingshengii]|nr:hypothetical protein RQCS_11470 [Rhodococcus qingshengii]
MLSENDVGPRESLEQSVVDHGLRTRAKFLSRLEDEDKSARPGRRILREDPGRTE